MHATSQALRPDLWALLRPVSRSFYLSIRLLPLRLQAPIALAYLLARASDTLADSIELPVSQRQDQLAELIAAIEGQSSLAASASLASRQLRNQHEQALIAALSDCLEWLDRLTPEDRCDVRLVLRLITRGQALDLARFGQNRSPPAALETAAQLEEYIYLVAGCVGEFWTNLCFRHLPNFATLPQPQMLKLGRAYGTGLQLVNIVRDVATDLAAGRCYFPADELTAAGLQPQDIMHQPERFEGIQNRWREVAQQRLELGMCYVDAICSRRVRAASALPALLGARTLTLLGAASSQNLQCKIKVPRREVHSIMMQLAFTFAARAPLKALFSRLRSLGK